MGGKQSLHSCTNYFGAHHQPSDGAHATPSPTGRVEASRSLRAWGGDSYRSVTSAVGVTPNGWLPVRVWGPMAQDLLSRSKEYVLVLVPSWHTSWCHRGTPFDLGYVAVADVMCSGHLVLL